MTGRGASLREASALSEARLTQAGVPSPRSDVALLLSHAMGVDRSEVQRRTLLGAELTREQCAVFADLVARRVSREPVQHLTGTAAFRRLDLQVGPGVFIPRPETEVVAGLAIAHLSAAALTRSFGEPPLVVDLCAGSGAIALAVKDEIPCADVHAVEISEAALAWARRNVSATGLSVTLHEADATILPTSLRALRGRCEVVVSNPPYIPPDAVPRDPEVARHDPPRSLYGGGDDGLDIPRAVLGVAQQLLARGGRIILEHADTQAAALRTHLEDDGRWRDVRAHTDLAGRPRAVSATRA